MRKPRLVLDTNVVVSAHLSSQGFERFVFDLAVGSRALLYTSDAIVQEYKAVLMRPKFGLPPALLAESFRLIEQVAVRVAPAARVEAAADPDDDKFLECAQAARADFLVTGNKRHFPQRWKSTEVVNARELTALLLGEL
jgi:putative PIN family toxin of toxin-antitoxin system